MRTRLNKHQLPRNWTGLPLGRLLLAETDISVRPGSRLRLKLLVFASQQDMRRFLMKNLHTGFRRNMDGVVQNLTQTIISFKDGQRQPPYRQVDPRYFSIMGLVVGRMGIQIITHESVHAALNYSRRIGPRLVWPDQKDCPDESICYAAGRIAQAVWMFVCSRGFISL